MTVLVVDDNQDLTGLIATFLKEKGIDSVVTNDPQEGLDLIKEKNYDMIFLDILMPEFSGIDIIYSLENDKILRNQKIVIFSGADFTPSKINDLIKKDGIKGHLKKPILFPQLLTAISNLCDSNPPLFQKIIHNPS